MRQDAAKIWNSTKKVKVVPVPGTSTGGGRSGARYVEPESEEQTKGETVEQETEADIVQPYISCISEYQAEKVVDGFVIVGCDGVWDEMSSGEAVQIVSELIAGQAQAGGSTDNIAELFIDKVLEKVVERLRATFKEEADLTLNELKQRPAGKGMHVVQDADGTDCKKYRRSCLHDDITVIILHFTSAAGHKAQVDVASGLASDKRSASALAANESLFALVEASAEATAAANAAESEVVSISSRQRSRTIINDDDAAISARESGGLSRKLSRTHSGSPSMVMAPSGRPDLTSPNTILALAHQMGLAGVSADEAAACAAMLKDAKPSSDSDHALHVRHIVAGQLETKGELESLFSQYGEVRQAVVRHREDAEGINTSWALVYMADEAGCEAALAGNTVNPYTGTVAHVSRFNQKIAAASTGGGMAHVLQTTEFERWAKEYARQQSMKKWGGVLRIVEE
jgi:hypothetical protein